MKRFILTLAMTVMFTTLAFSQNRTQTVRGTLLDTDSKLPLISATVIISGSNPLMRIQPI